MARNDILARSKKRKAEAFYHAGRLEEAQAVYRAICEANRSDADSWVMLSVIQRRLGQLQESEQCSRRALTIQPKHPIAHHALGAALHDQGHLEEAIACYRTALQLYPGLSETHYFLGNALRELGVFEEAITHYREAVRSHPRFVEAMSNLGAMLRHCGRPEEALRVLSRAQHVRPNDARVLCNVGGTLLSLNRVDEALDRFSQAAKVDPGFFDAHYLQGETLRRIGRFDDALAAYRMALTLQPNDPSAILGIAEILEMRGERTEAEALIRSLVEAEPGNCRALALYASLSRGHERSRAAVALLENRLTKGQIDRLGQIQLHYALGKLYDTVEEFEKAFSHIALAKTHVRIHDKATFEKFGPTEQTRRVNAWCRADRDFWNSLPRANNNDERPIFVVGMQRSGTTLAEQILATHPNVHGAGELSDIGEIGERLRHRLGGDYPECLSRLAPNLANDAAQRYLDHLTALSPEARRVVDKMPGNFQRLGLISLLFPKARVIHMRRDPLDTCLSIYFQNFSTTNAYAFDLRDLGAHYKAYRRLMAHWHEALTIPVLEVPYEELVKEPDTWIRRMLAFCNLEWDDRCLRFYDTKRDVNTPSYNQVKQPIYARSVGRWKNYERHLGPLIESLGDSN